MMFKMQLLALLLFQSSSPATVLGCAYDLTLRHLIARKAPLLWHRSERVGLPGSNSVFSTRAIKHPTLGAGVVAKTDLGESFWADQDEFLKWRELEAPLRDEASAKAYLLSALREGLSCRPGLSSELCRYLEESRAKLERQTLRSPDVGLRVLRLLARENLVRHLITELPDGRTVRGENLDQDSRLAIAFRPALARVLPLLAHRPAKMRPLDLVGAGKSAIQLIEEPFRARYLNWPLVFDTQIRLGSLKFKTLLGSVQTLEDEAQTVTARDAAEIFAELAEVIADALEDYADLAGLEREPKLQFFVEEQHAFGSGAPKLNVEFYLTDLSRTSSLLFYYYLAARLQKFE